MRPGCDDMIPRPETKNLDALCPNAVELPNWRTARFLNPNTYNAWYMPAPRVSPLICGGNSLFH